MTAPRRLLLTAALGFSAIHWRAPFPPAAVALATWLDNWRGLGAVVGGMRRLGYDVELKQFPQAWRVNFRQVRRRACRRERVGRVTVASSATGGVAGAFLARHRQDR